MQSRLVRPMNSLLFVSDRNGGIVPEWADKQILWTPSCISVAWYPREAIDSLDNLVVIPRMKHWEINQWYQTRSPEFGWQTPRDYLEGRNWAVKRSVGLEALKIVGVLKP